MRVLLDECVPRALGKELVDHDVRTVAEAGWAGVTNGELLQRAAGLFDVLLTVDRNLEYQQNFAGVRLAVIVVHAPSNGRRRASPADAGGARRYRRGQTRNGDPYPAMTGVDAGLAAAVRPARGADPARPAVDRENGRAPAGAVPCAIADEAGAGAGVMPSLRGAKRDEAIQRGAAELDCFASLAMTPGSPCGIMHLKPYAF
jgi:PIN like domain